MDNAVLVRGLKGARDLARDRDRIVDRNRALGDSLGERRSLDELEHQRVNLAVSTRLSVRWHWLSFLRAVDGADRRMIERREDLRLGFQPCQAIGIRLEIRWQQLQRDGACELAVASAIHLAHPANAEQLFDLVVFQS